MHSLCLEQAKKKIILVSTTGIFIKQNLIMECQVKSQSSP